jgi:hypothetical protein
VYGLRFAPNLVLNPTNFDCSAKLANHSHDPNCVLQRWMCGGEVVFAVAALRDLRAGEFVTFDYGMEALPGRQRTPCVCRAVACTAWLEAAPAAPRPSTALLGARTRWTRSPATWQS